MNVDGEASEMNVDGEASEMNGQSVGRDELKGQKDSEHLARVTFDKDAPSLATTSTSIKGDDAFILYGTKIKRQPSSNSHVIQLTQMVTFLLAY